METISPEKATRDKIAAIENCEPPAPESAIMNAEMVVPMFAPIIMEVACVKVISPTLTKPTIITVVAAELFTIAVTTAPVPTPAKRFEVVLDISERKPLPAAFSMLPPIRCIPIINTVMPPKRKNALLIIVITSAPANNRVDVIK